RHRLRKARLVDQSVSSNARRAASIARCMSAFDASATSPNTSSVAGLMFVNVPASPSTSVPLISILGSKRTSGISDLLLPLFRRGPVDGRSVTAWQVAGERHDAEGASPNGPRDEGAG